MVGFEILPILGSAKKELVRLELLDEIGLYTDELTLIFPNSFLRPPSGFELAVTIGFQYYGIFAIQTTNKTDSNLVVKAIATNFNNSIKEKKNRSFEKIKLCAIISKIANEHKLKSKCDFKISVKHESQTNESDLNFLHRLATKFNAQFNIKNNTIIFLKHKEENKALPIFIISKNEVSHYSIKHKAKPHYKSAIAKWHDTKSNKEKKITVGKGKPIFYIQNRFKNEAEAHTEAKSKLKSLNRGTIEGSITLPGKEIRAGGILLLIGFFEDDGKYSIKRVTHTIDNNGYLVQVEFEK